MQRAGQATTWLLIDADLRSNVFRLSDVVLK